MVRVVPHPWPTSKAPLVEREFPTGQREHEDGEKGVKLHLTVKRCFLHGGLVFGLDRCSWVVVESMCTDLRLLCILFHCY